MKKPSLLLFVFFALILYCYDPCGFRPFRSGGGSSLAPCATRAQLLPG